MNTTINEQRFPSRVRAMSDGSVAGTRFYNDSGDVVVPAGVTVQQEGLSTVRLRFDARYAIKSLAMGPDDTLTINMGQAD